MESGITKDKSATVIPAMLEIDAKIAMRVTKEIRFLKNATLTVAIMEPMIQLT